MGKSKQCPGGIQSPERDGFGMTRSLPLSGQPESHRECRVCPKLFRRLHEPRVGHAAPAFAGLLPSHVPGPGPAPLPGHKEPCGDNAAAHGVPPVLQGHGAGRPGTEPAWTPGPDEGAAALPDGVLAKVDLKSFVEQQRLEGYDPNLDVLLVTEEKLQCLVELQQAVLQCVAGGQGSSCHVVHVVSCEEEFRQQQMDLLWRILDPGAHTALQKHLVCGPVKVAKPSSPIGADQYFQLRKRQMYEASVMKYGELAQGEGLLRGSTCRASPGPALCRAACTTAHLFPQIVLDLEDSSISTKGTKSGAFVMYNCARLATLFDTYQRAVERGTYPPLPPPSELNFSCLREEGEWLLLFNYLLPFPEVLQQAAQLPAPSKGIRITASTESVCKFLIQLSMDFSSYYNRVHVLGEPFPHLFDQMFARLQLLAAVRDMFHSALATLHLPPLSQI
nr:PREDICTED: DALR anticodon-binding domain-containing protein 3 [Apteryx mantelli mantelli]